MEIYNDMKANPKKYSTLVGGSILMLSLGSIGTFGNIAPYFISYLRENKSHDHVRYSQTIYVHTTQIIALSVSAFMVSILKDRFQFSPKQAAFVGTIFLRLTFILFTNLSTDQNWRFFILVCRFC